MGGEIIAVNQITGAVSLKAMGDADVIVYLAPVSDSLENYEKFLKLNKKNIPHIIALTKIDQSSQAKLLKKIALYNKYANEFKALIPISNSKKLGYEDLLNEIEKLLPHSPYLYDPQDLTDELVRNIYKEFIREAVFENISDEVPYESDVIIEKIYEEHHIDKIYATIIVEKQSQKGIIIGRNGEAIKRIGKAARKKIEELSQKQCYLNLEVSVKKGWSKDKAYLEKIGYKQ
jgi:GTP-binding protein Era